MKDLTERPVQWMQCFKNKPLRTFLGKRVNTLQLRDSKAFVSSSSLTPKPTKANRGALPQSTLGIPLHNASMLLVFGLLLFIALYIIRFEKQGETLTTKRNKQTKQHTNNISTTIQHTKPHTNRPLHLPAPFDHAATHTHCAHRATISYGMTC